MKSSTPHHHPLRNPSLRAVLAGCGTVAVLGALLTACDGGDGGGGASGRSDGRGGQEIVTVTRESMDVVTTVPATVRAGTRVEVTAPGAGTVESLSKSGVTVRLDEAKSDKTKSDRAKSDKAKSDEAKSDKAKGGDSTVHEVKLDFPSGLKVTDELVDEGQHVPANYPLARGRIEGFAMVAELDQQSLYKVYSPPLSARAQINEGPGPFDCPLANTVPTGTANASAPQHPAGDDEFADEDGPASSADSGMRLVCVVPSDVDVFAGMAGVMAIRTASVKDALLLPVEAVAGDSSRGEVTVVKPGGGGTESRTVRLGASDGGQVELVSGVREGEKVRVPAPNLAGTGDLDGGES